MTGGDKAKQCTKFEVSSFIGFGDIIQDKPNFPGVKLKLCTKLELSSFTSFGDKFEGLLKILSLT